MSTTGVAGLTLGGGSGWLERKHGLTCDSLIWALHGGGGNFGIATSFEFELHDLGPEVFAGLLLWPGDAAGDVARAYRDTADDAPDEFGSALVFLTGPPEDFVPKHLQGHTVAAIAFMWAGDLADGADVIAPFRDLRPDADLAGPMPYADFQCMIDDPPGLGNSWTATSTMTSTTRRSTRS